MSAAASPAPVAVPMDQHLAMDANLQSRKSYRRKYRKIMVKFEQTVQESNGLFKDEQRIFDISQRLAEETDQILQLLLELNRRPQVPKRLRYDLKPTTSNETDTRSRSLLADQNAHETLRLARYQVQKGELGAYEYETMQEDLLASKDFAPARSYAALMKDAAISIPAQDITGASKTSTVGILTAKQEEQYLQSLEDFFDGKTNDARAHAAKSLGSRNAERTADREREIQLKNPVSAYNWLRKHQPQVFLQDHELPGEKGKSSGSRTSKRTTQSKQDVDYYDEDGIAMDQVGSVRGKRKREDDSAFRPKGGRSAHPSKRRKEESGGKRSKRSSMDARNS